MDRGADQARITADLATLPGAVPRPGSEREPPRPRLPYLLPARGRLLIGVGEISDGGVHSRGLTLAVAAGQAAIAPAPGRIVYAAPFRSYANVLIIDHGRGWATVITGLGSLDVARGATVTRGETLGRVGREARLIVELRRNGRPVALAQLVSG